VVDFESGAVGLSIVLLWVQAKIFSMVGMCTELRPGHDGVVVGQEIQFAMELVINGTHDITMDLLDFRWQGLFVNPEFPLQDQFIFEMNCHNGWRRRSRVRSGRTCSTLDGGGIVGVSIRYSDTLVMGRLRWVVDSCGGCTGGGILHSNVVRFVAVGQNTKSIGCGKPIQRIVHVVGGGVDSPHGHRGEAVMNRRLVVGLCNRSPFRRNQGFQNDWIWGRPTIGRWWWQGYWRRSRGGCVGAVGGRRRGVVGLCVVTVHVAQPR
jgi:hypothetical protein